MLAVVLVTPLVVGLAGGFSAAPARELPQIEPGEAVATGPYELALQNYFVTDEVRANSLPEGARAWLGVVATVTGTDDEEAVLNRFVTTYPEGLGVVDADSTVNPQPATALRQDTGELAGPFPPGLQVPVVWLIPVADDEAVPAQLTVGITDLEQAWSPLLEQETWYEREDIGQVTLVRTDTVPQGLIEDDEEQGDW